MSNKPVRAVTTDPSSLIRIGNHLLQNEAPRARNVQTAEQTFVGGGKACNSMSDNPAEQRAKYAQAASGIHSSSECTYKAIGNNEKHSDKI